MIYYFCFHFTASEENAAKLRDDILARTGKITDVVSCMGSWQKWWQKGPLLDQPVSDFTKVSLEYHNYNKYCMLLNNFGTNHNNSYSVNYIAV